jgi:hypothetical protein
LLLLLLGDESCCLLFKVSPKNPMIYSLLLLTLLKRNNE